MRKDHLETEFGRYTSWMLDAVTELALPDPIPAVCRGTGHPALLESLADAIRAAPGMRVLDLGCGMGGPGAWLQRERGCRTVGIDLMEPNVRAARSLFGKSNAVVASTVALPFPDAVFDALWAVGVLEMVDDKAAALTEAARVLGHDGRMAAYTFTSRDADLPDPPLTDTFVSPEAMTSMFAAAGLAVVDARPSPALSPIPRDWATARSAVQDAVRARHASEKDFTAVRSELDRFNVLRAAGRIEAWQYELVKEA